VLPPTYVPGGTPEPALALAPAPPLLRWLRNKYLHRSAHSIAEGKDAYLGMDGNYNHRRVIIRDTVRLDKFSKPYIDRAKRYYHHPTDLGRDAAQSVKRKLDELRKKLF